MWRQLVIDTLMRPRDAAGRVLALQVPPAVLAQGALLIACASMLLAYLALLVGGAAIDPVSAMVLDAPIAAAGAQFAMMALIVALTYRLGRAFGGKGAFLPAATAVVWLNAVTLLIQAAQVVVLAIAPPIAGLISIATVIWLLWAYANFIAELHGFDSPVVVLGVVVLTAVMTVLGVTFLAAILGIAPEGVQ